MNKKIAMFIPNMNIGGAEKVALNLCREFLNSNIEVDLILLKKKGKYLKQIPSDVNIVDLNCNRSIKSIPKLMRYINNSDINCLISFLPHMNIAAIIAKKLSKKKMTKMMMPLRARWQKRRYQLQTQMPECLSK